MNQRRVKIGIIGCGDIVKKKFLKALSQIDSAQLVCVCDLVEDRAKEVCALGNAQQWYTDYQKMLNEADIEAVIVTTPHPYHALPVIAAAKAGKHILVEKPMAIQEQELDAMVEAVNEAGVKLVALPFIHSPAFLRCKEIIGMGCIGEVVDIDAITISGVFPPAPWYVSKKAGVGSIADIGIYSISTVIGLMGPVSGIQAITTISSGTANLPDGTVCNLEMEDNARLILRYANGKIGSITCGWSHGDGMSTVRIYGRDGVIILDGWENGTLLLRPKKTDLDLPELKTAQTVEFLGKKYYVLKNEGTYGKPAVEYLINAIVNDLDLSKDVARNRHVMEVILKAYESAEKNTGLL